jgi:hypothetical protein
MAHFLALRNRKPNAAQKAKIAKALREIGSNHGDKLHICGGARGEQAFYVEAPDYWGASHMAEACDQVRTAVTEVMGEK